MKISCINDTLYCSCIFVCLLVILTQPCCQNFSVIWRKKYLYLWNLCITKCLFHSKIASLQVNRQNSSQTTILNRKIVKGLVKLAIIVKHECVTMGYKPQKGTHKMHSGWKRMNHQQQQQLQREHQTASIFLCVAAPKAAASSETSAALTALTLAAKEK